MRLMEPCPRRASIPATRTRRRSAASGRRTRSSGLARRGARGHRALPRTAGRRRSPCGRPTTTATARAGCSGSMTAPAGSWAARASSAFESRALFPGEMGAVGTPRAPTSSGRARPARQRQSAPRASPTCARSRSWSERARRSSRSARRRSPRRLPSRFELGFEGRTSRPMRSRPSGCAASPASAADHRRLDRRRQGDQLYLAGPPRGGRASLRRLGGDRDPDRRAGRRGSALKMAFGGWNKIGIALTSQASRDREGVRGGRPARGRGRRPTGSSGLPTAPGAGRRRWRRSPTCAELGLDDGIPRGAASFYRAVSRAAPPS